MSLPLHLRISPVLIALLLLLGCGDDAPPTEEEPQIPDDIFAPFGDPLPTATEDQLQAFDRGRQLTTHRFTPDDGLGPHFNVDSCASCHFNPAPGGTAPRYRNFFLVGQKLDDGTFLMGPRDGILHTYGVEPYAQLRPGRSDRINVFAQRNPLPLFGTGLIAEIPEESILANADPDDESGNGIAGRPNWDRGFVGRFGRKAQTVDIQGFIRGPIFNHMGITTDPLPDAMAAQLPVPSDGDGPIQSEDLDQSSGDLQVRRQAQAAPPSEPLEDGDSVPDPELGTNDLFDLISFNMLLAAPPPEEPTDASQRGEDHFHAIGCADCHVPTLRSERGDIPLYSDLLLHEMGPELADGIEMGVATGSEFRTQPLWGVAASGPWLHDGRADTLVEAIEWHGGTAAPARDRFQDLDDEKQSEVIAFLHSLGGAQFDRPGLIDAHSPIPQQGQPGAPLPDLTDDQLQEWIAGRVLFDRNTSITKGLGDPHFNGDSCRACHGDVASSGLNEALAIGTHGPLDVSVTRAGTWTDEGAFLDAFDHSNIIDRLAIPGEVRREPADDLNTFELRTSPSLLGIGLIDAIDDEVILANEDPNDDLQNGIYGRASRLDDGRLGRFGWKADIPDLREFARDALSNELGLTLPEEPGFFFGDTALPGDQPEASAETIDLLTAFMAGLAPPPSQDTPSVEGEQLFHNVGCADCHIPQLDGPSGPVPLYSDLLLHDVAPDDHLGIPTPHASHREFRTPPLWGVSQTAPYMHDGRAFTLRGAIEAHHNTAAPARDAFLDLGDDEQQKVIEFLEGI